MEPITVSVVVKAPLAKVWEFWNAPEHITQWCAASPEWHAPSAENDVAVGKKFTTRMEAKDGSAGFDFSGTYTAVEEGKNIAYTMDDGRTVKIEFTETEDGVSIVETFDPETENSRALQQEGWQSILDNFKRYVEGQ